MSKKERKKKLAHFPVGSSLPPAPPISSLRSSGRGSDGTGGTTRRRALPLSCVEYFPFLSHAVGTRRRAGGARSGRARQRQQPSPASLSTVGGIIAREGEEDQKRKGKENEELGWRQTRNWNSVKKSRSRRVCMQGTWRRCNALGACGRPDRWHQQAPAGLATAAGRYMVGRAHQWASTSGNSCVQFQEYRRSPAARCAAACCSAAWSPGNSGGVVCVVCLGIGRRCAEAWLVILAELWQVIMAALQ